MSIFDGLEIEAYDRKYSEIVLIKRILHYFRPFRLHIAGAAIMMLIISGIAAFFPVIVSQGVDTLDSSRQVQTANQLALVIFLLAIIRWVANWMRRRWMVRAIAGVVLGLATDAFHASMEHDLSFHDEFSSGKLQSRITSDTRDFGGLIEVITDVGSQFIEAIVLGIVLVNIQWRLAMYIFALMPVIFGFAIVYRKIARKVTREGMQAMASVNATIKETVSGIAVAKNFRQEAGIYQEFETANKLSYRVNVRRGIALSVVFPILNGISGVALAVLVYVGGLDVIGGVVTVGAWYLFLLSLDSFLYPMLSLSSFMTQIQGGLSAAERVFALIDAPHSVVQKGREHVTSLNGEIKFQNVNFWYRDGEIILKDFNLHINPGETIALVGHTGAGKSSIVKLIERFYEFQSGQILVDGKDIRKFDLTSYRSQFGIVTQTPFLFSGSVAENIRYARNTASDEDILVMARKVGDGEWLETLPQGLQTEVGERGGQLSMGQRQMVALMRVLVQRPAIFILDEATASIDPFTEWQIQQALKLILAQSTSILIAHRLSTVRSADRILVMKQGSIIEEGSHNSLLSQGGHYAELYNTYFRHQSLEYVQQSRVNLGI